MLNIIMVSVKSRKIAKKQVLRQIISDKYFFVVNPNAGYGRLQREWQKISRLISNEDIDYDFEFTGYVGHAKKIVSVKINEGYRKFIVFGGDGTLNEVVNAIFRQTEVPTTDITIGIFSMGTGNDWAKYYDFPKGYAESIDRILHGTPMAQDIGKIIYDAENNKKNAYFINVAGMCLDAVVVNETNKLKAKGKRAGIGYFSSLIKNCMKHKSSNLKILINDEIIDEKILSVSIGIGKYSGGGMIQTPAAVIDDGFFDVTIYPNMNKRKIFTCIRKLHNGNILTVKEVKSYRTKLMKIYANNKVFAETDGEVIGSGPYEISILPKSINILT